MNDRALRLKAFLESLVEREKLLGAAIISRDGLPITTMGRLETNRETFSAMSATVMGAAEIALGELEGGRTRSIVAATERATMILVGVSGDLILVGYAPANVATAQLLPRIEAAALDVAKTLAGA